MDALYLRNYIFKVGVGHGLYKLTAFDRALSMAGVSDYSLIKISSILPPNCLRQNDITLPKGMLLPSAFATIYSDKIGETISSAVAVCIPKNTTDVGVIMEHSSISSKIEAEETAKALAVQAMQDRGIPFSEVISTAVECTVETHEKYCAFATVSLW